jgi:hypothetical protein
VAVVGSEHGVDDLAAGQLAALEDEVDGRPEVARAEGHDPLLNTSRYE